MAKEYKFINCDRPEFEKIFGYKSSLFGIVQEKDPKEISPDDDVYIAITGIFDFGNKLPDHCKVVSLPVGNYDGLQEWVGEFKKDLDYLLECGKEYFNEE